MKYRGVIAIMDGVPDSQGDGLSSDVKFPECVPTTYEFDTSKFIGMSKISKEGIFLVAEIDIQDGVFTQDILETLTGVVGGVKPYPGGTSFSWELRSVGLTEHPADKRLPKLKRFE